MADFRKAQDRQGRLRFLPILCGQKKEKGVQIGSAKTISLKIHSNGPLLFLIP
jgi:hypothetical protein